MRPRRDQPRATPAILRCRWPPFFRDSHSHLAAVAARCQPESDRCRPRLGATVLQILLGITGTSLLINEIDNRMHMPAEQQNVMKMMAKMKRERQVD